MSLKNTLYTILSWRSTPPQALGKHFEKVIAAYAQGGFAAVEPLLKSVFISGRQRADAYTALARHLMSKDRAQAAQAAKKAHAQDPKAYRLKWLIFRLYDAGEIGEAKALLDTLPAATSFSESEARRAKQLRGEAKIEELRKEVKSGADINKRYLKTIGKIRLAAALKGKTSGTQSPQTPQYIVTLTSYGERLTKTAPYAIASLLAQMEQPDRIMLWVAHGDGARIYDANADVTALYAELIAKGVEIRYCEDLKSYKKLIPALREFPEDILITADDDSLYPFDWFAKLKATAAENPGSIICHRAHEILVDAEHYPLAYRNWKKNVPEEDFTSMANSAAIFPVGIGGILYPPHSISEALNIRNSSNIYRLTCDTLPLLPTVDNIWFWAMAKLAGTEYVVVPKGYRKDMAIDEKISDQRRASITQYTEQLAIVLKEYPKLQECLNKIAPCIPYRAARQEIVELPPNITLPSISIIIPVYNAAAWIERCFKSIIAAVKKYDDYQPIDAKPSANAPQHVECIFVDDCSTDDSVVILENLISENAGKIKFHVLKHTKNSRAGITRNTGIRSARGEYTIFVDADDELFPDSLLAMASLAAKYPGVDMVKGEAIRLGKKIEIQSNIGSHYFPEYTDDVLWIRQRLGIMQAHDNIRQEVWASLYRRQFLVENNLQFSELFAANDQHFSFLVSKKIKHIAFTTIQVYSWHCDHVSHINSLNINSDHGIMKKRIDAHFELCFFILKNMDNEIFNEQLGLVLHNLEHHISRPISSSGLKAYSDRTATLENEIFQKISLKDGFPKNFINPRQAYQLGIREVVTNSMSIGDALMTLAYSEVYFHKTGKKLLLLSAPKSQKEQFMAFFANCKFCYVLTNFTGEDIYRPQGNLLSLSSANGEKFVFDVKFIIHHQKTGQDENTNRLGGKFMYRLFPLHYITASCQHLGLSGDIEIKPHLELTASEKSFGRFAPSDKKQIAIMTGGKIKYKALPFSTTQKIVDMLSSEYIFVQIGSKSDAGLHKVKDLRGQLSLREVASVLHNSDIFVGTIGGLMHLARAVDCPAVIAYSAEPIELVSFTGNSYVFSETPCDLCASNQIDPCRDFCPNDYRCIRNISAEKIAASIREKLAMPRVFPQQTATCIAKESPTNTDHIYYYKTYPTKGLARLPIFHESGSENNFIDPETAYRMGYREVISNSNAVGDSLLTLAFAEQYYKKTKRKLLIITGKPGRDESFSVYFAGSKFCYVLLDLDGNIVNDEAKDTLTFNGDASFVFAVKYIKWAGNHFRQNADGKWCRKFIKKHYITACCEYLGLNGEIEIRPHWELTDAEKSFGRFASGKPQVAIMSTGRMKYKSLPFDTIQAIVDRLKDDCFFVQIGSSTDAELHGTYDFRGTELRQVASVLHNSDLFVGTIGGLMHLARAVDCPAVIAYSAEPIELVSFTGNSYVFSDTPCEVCANGELDPYMEVCPYDYKCIRNVAPEKMVAAIKERLMEAREFPRQTDFCQANPARGIDVFRKLYNHKILDKNNKFVNNGERN